MFIMFYGSNFENDFTDFFFNFFDNLILVILNWYLIMKNAPFSKEKGAF